MTWLWWAGTLPPFGFITPILFVVAGRRVRKPAWLRWAALYALVVYGGLIAYIIAPEDSDADGLSALVMTIGWGAGIAHGFVARFEYERRLGGELSPVEEARRTLEMRREAQRLAREEPQVALEMGVGRPDRDGATHMHVVDINHANEPALARLPGIDRELAHEICSARKDIDGFKSVEDLGVVLRLDGDAVEDLRPYVVFLPR